MSQKAPQIGDSAAQPKAYPRRAECVVADAVLANASPTNHLTIRFNFSATCAETCGFPAGGRGFSVRFSGMGLGIFCPRLRNFRDEEQG